MPVSEPGCGLRWRRHRASRDRRRVVELALDRFGRIDTLLNNAGVFIRKLFTDYTPDGYAAVTAVNLARFFHITQLAIRLFALSARLLVMLTVWPLPWATIWDTDARCPAGYMCGPSGGSASS